MEYHLLYLYSVELCTDSLNAHVVGQWVESDLVVCTYIVFAPEHSLQLTALQNYIRRSSCLFLSVLAK